jgi:hypothetical protein
MTEAAQKKTHADDKPIKTFDPGLIFTTQSDLTIPLRDLNNTHLSITPGSPDPAGVRSFEGSLILPLFGYITPDGTISFTLKGLPYKFIGVFDSLGNMQGNIYSNSTNAGQEPNGDDGTWSAQAPRP